MEEPPVVTLATFFTDLDDPRHSLGRRHELLDIVVIAICAIICGADTWVDVTMYGRIKED